jgi:alpha-glucosidase
MVPDTFNSPGKFVILARKKGDRWYIAGINGENSKRTITLNVPFISDISKGIIIADSINAKDFIKREINFSALINITMHPYGGFIIQTLLKGEKSDSY